MSFFSEIFKDSTMAKSFLGHFVTTFLVHNQDKLKTLGDTAINAIPDGVSDPGHNANGPDVIKSVATAIFNESFDAVVNKAEESYQAEKQTK
jgi:hypothetical protein